MTPSSNLNQSGDTEMVSIPKHIITRLSACYKMGGFMNKNLPILVHNALDEITHYDYGSSQDVRFTMRKKVSQVRRNGKSYGVGA